MNTSSLISKQSIENFGFISFSSAGYEMVLSKAQACALMGVSGGGKINTFTSSGAVNLLQFSIL